MSNSDSLEYKIWHPEDEKPIHGMLESASLSHKQQVLTYNWFKWKFSKSPFGHPIISYAQATDGTIAGVVAFGMYELSIHNKNIKAALSYETFVHPKFQGKGLFTKLTKAAMEEAQKRNIELLFNFPNTNSLPGFKKLGWKIGKGIKLWVRPASYLKFLLKFDIKALKQSFIPDKEDSNKKFNPEIFNDLKYNTLNKQVSGYYTPFRTKEYLQWRFASYPHNTYKVIKSTTGACVVRTGRRGKYTEAQILEFFPNDNFTKSYLKATLKSVEQEIMPDLITINISKSHPANSLLYKFLFFSLPNKINFTTYPINKENIDLANNDWVITGTEFHTY